MVSLSPLVTAMLLGSLGAVYIEESRQEIQTPFAVPAEQHRPISKKHYATHINAGVRSSACRSNKRDAFSESKSLDPCHLHDPQ